MKKGVGVCGAHGRSAAGQIGDSKMSLIDQFERVGHPRKGDMLVGTPRAVLSSCDVEPSADPTTQQVNLTFFLRFYVKPGRLRLKARVQRKFLLPVPLEIALAG
ncbi:hypothetical protein OSTOST_06931 [Ostertagia ostertagi]